MTATDTQKNTVSGWGGASAFLLA